MTTQPGPRPAGFAPARPRAAAAAPPPPPRPLPLTIACGRPLRCWPLVGRARRCGAARWLLLVPPTRRTVVAGSSTFSRDPTTAGVMCAPCVGRSGSAVGCRDRLDSAGAAAGPFTPGRPVGPCAWRRGGSGTSLPGAARLRVIPRWRPGDGDGAGIGGASGGDTGRIGGTAGEGGREQHLPHETDDEPARVSVHGSSGSSAGGGDGGGGGGATAAALSAARILEVSEAYV
ncbi:hypothetical protein PLESTM_000602100 [Pleodorina starrii]|nr:hypothetical protein PLESTM_000602100 [Pleodorina starrii]